MHVEYKITLPDHDWVKAEKHKLIPSVYAGLVIKENGMGDPNCVTYSGPTVIRIRSAKHDGSSAATHANDVDFLLDSENFESLCKTSNGLVKPIIIVSTDGGPDENPRYETVIKNAIRHFKKYDLDAIFLVTNAPGRSAFNPVERRMAPLSEMTSGVILDHDHYGSHLDEKGATVDLDLEKKNFKHAGETLSEIWNSLVIDGYPVQSDYVEPPKSEVNKIFDIDPIWYSQHVRSSQYLLQVSKCNSSSCCGTHRSMLRKVLKTGFLPPPLKVKSSLESFMIPAELSDKSGKFLPLFTQLAVDLKHNPLGFMQVIKYFLIVQSLLIQK